MINWIKSIFKKQDWLIKPNHEVKLAFIGSDGTEYFEFVNGFDMYYERYMAIMDRLSEIEKRVDKVYLDTFIKTQREYINKGDLGNAAVTLNFLEQRQNYIFNQELLYNLASCWYFDKSENPYSYNPEYADIKIKKWKNEKGRLSFFLQHPIGKYMPSIKRWESSLENLEKAVNIETITQLKFHLQNISETPKGKELKQTLGLQLQQLEELVKKT